MDYQSVFERVEAKYSLNRKQYEQFMEIMNEYFVPDLYPHSDISTIYFDTDDYRLIRNSIDKGVYREKFRLRSYSMKDDTSEVFLEMKKKYHGVTYKRRLAVTYREAMNYILFEKMPNDTQIMKEIDYLMKKYTDLKPRVLIRYQRDSYVSRQEHTLRVTFDYEIKYSLKNVCLKNNIPEKKLTNEDMIIMEVKSMNAMPLWMTAALDKLMIYPCNFSKYGQIYTTDIIKGGRKCSKNYSHQYTAEPLHLKYLSSARLHQ